MASKGFQNSLSDVSVAGTASGSGGGGARPIAEPTALSSALTGISSIFKSAAPMISEALNDYSVSKALEPFTKLEEAQLQGSITPSQYRNQWKTAELTLLREDPTQFNAVMESLGGSRIAAENRQQNMQDAKMMAFGHSLKEDLTDEEALTLGEDHTRKVANLERQAKILASADKADEKVIESQVNKAPGYARQFIDVTFGSAFDNALTEFSRNFDLYGADSAKLQGDLHRIRADFDANRRLARTEFLKSLESSHSSVRKAALESFDDSMKNLSSLLNVEEMGTYQNIIKLNTLFKSKTELNMLQSSDLIARVRALGGERGIETLVDFVTNNNMDIIMPAINRFLASGGISQTGQDPLAIFTTIASTTKNPNAISRIPDEHKPGAIRTVSTMMNRIVGKTGEMASTEVAHYGALASNLALGATTLKTPDAKISVLSSLNSESYSKMLGKMNNVERQGVSGVATGAALHLGTRAAIDLGDFARSVTGASVSYNPSLKRFAVEVDAGNAMVSPEDVGLQSNRITPIAQKAAEIMNQGIGVYQRNAKYDPNLSKLSEDQLADLYVLKIQELSNVQLAKEVTYPPNIGSQDVSRMVPATMNDLTTKLADIQASTRGILQLAPDQLQKVTEGIGVGKLKAPTNSRLLKWAGN